MNIFYKASAFIKKDFFIQISYKTSFILDWLHTFVTIVTFYFISKLMGTAVTPYLIGYSTEYFPFVMVGLIFSGYLNTALQKFAINIRHEQLMGTLEAMLVSPTKMSLIIIGISLWDLIFTSITTVIVLLFGSLTLKVDLSHINFFPSFLILAMTIISFSSIGIISAAFVIVLKKGNPINWLIYTFTCFLGGVFFPVEMLPRGLRTISYFIPATYSLRGLRHAILQGYNFEMLFPDIAALFLFCLLLFPISIWVFIKSVNQAKISGSLAHY